MKIKDHLLYYDNGAQVDYIEVPHKGGVIIPQYAVIHYDTSKTQQQTINWFLDKNSKVSAHLSIDRDGKIMQFAKFNIKCWHCGESYWKGISGLNSHSLGIELVNQGRSSIPKDGWIRATHKNETTPAYWEPYTCKQIDTLVEVMKALKSTYKLKEVLGHDDISPGRKSDPGPAFDMVKFRADTGFITATEYYVTTATLNLREGANTTFKILSVLPKDTKMKKISENGDWYKVSVESNGLKGWVNKNYLNKI